MPRNNNKKRNNIHQSGQLPYNHNTNATGIVSGKHTIAYLIRWASKVLKKKGIDSPQLDAEVILAHLIGCTRTDIHINPDRPVEDEIVVKYREAIQRRAQRVPVQYITNKVEFMSLDFYVNEHVLIPRPETEIVVEALIKKAQSISKEDEIIIVDVGVGSGNIAVALAKNLPNAIIFAIDISPDALAVARINAQRHEVLDQITLLCGDIFKPLEGYGLESMVNFIISNPPYISSNEFPTLQEEVRNYEPYVALVSGHDSLQMFKRITLDAHIWLKPGGFIIFEVGEKQARKVGLLVKDTGHFKKIEFLKDYQQISRVVIAQMEGASGQNHN